MNDMMLQNTKKMQHPLAYNEATAPGFTFLESCHRADVKL